MFVAPDSKRATSLCAQVWLRTSHRLGTLPETARPRALWVLYGGFVFLRTSRSVVRARRFAALGAATVLLVSRSRPVVDLAIFHATSPSPRSPMLCNRLLLCDCICQAFPPRREGRPPTEYLPVGTLPTSHGPTARFPPVSSSSSPPPRSPMLCNRSPAARLHLPHLPPRGGKVLLQRSTFPRAQYRLPTPPPLASHPPHHRHHLLRARRCSATARLLPDCICRASPSCSDSPCTPVACRNFVRSCHRVPRRCRRTLIVHRSIRA